MIFRRGLSFILMIGACSPVTGQTKSLQARARESIGRAGRFFVRNTAKNGGFVYFHSTDLKRRYGEGSAKDSEIWVQPPGTPTVGLALLDAFRATNDRFFLTAAEKAAKALVYGQLKSGGWTNSIDFNPATARFAYRNGRGRGRNFSTLDDGITPSALQLLMHVDHALQFQNESIHEAAQSGLNCLLKAQFENGGFPQGWDQISNRNRGAIAAKFPEYDWKTEGRIKEYWNLYTLNDGVAGHVLRALETGHTIYGDARCLSAMHRLGAFLCLAQLPAPQPAWAQQYNYEMHPTWARKFEPPAIASRESFDAIRTLIRVFEITGDRRYLKPVPAALHYLRSCVLPDGQLARYYELHSNRPLYMTRRGSTYSLTYDDRRLPAHYGWKVTNWISDLETAYENAVNQRSPELEPLNSPTILRVMDQLDAQSRWISTYNGERLIGQTRFELGEQYLSSEVFSKNISLLSRFVLSNADGNDGN